MGTKGSIDRHGLITRNHGLRGLAQIARIFHSIPPFMAHLRLTLIIFNFPRIGIGGVAGGPSSPQLPVSDFRPGCGRTPCVLLFCVRPWTLSKPAACGRWLRVCLRRTHKTMHRMVLSTRRGWATKGCRASSMPWRRTLSAAAGRSAGSATLGKLYVALATRCRGFPQLNNHE
jgi:hypothetical protein